MSISAPHLSMPHFASFTPVRASRLVALLAAFAFFGFIASSEARASHNVSANARINGVFLENPDGTAANPTITSTNGTFVFAVDFVTNSGGICVTFTDTGGSTFVPATFCNTTSSTQTFPSGGVFNGTFNISNQGNPTYRFRNGATGVNPSFPVTLVTGPPPSTVTAGKLIISEARFRGLNGLEDEFIELYNNTDSSITVDADGFSLVSSDGFVLTTLPVGTVIPGRRHYLVANSTGYSLSGYPAGANATPGALPTSTATPDSTYAHDIRNETDGGVALFNTSTPANFDMGHRLDAFGMSAAAAIYREGSGYGPFMVNNSEASYWRHTAGPCCALPQDTDDNNADFYTVEARNEIFHDGRGGAPGPENSSSARVATLGIARLDPNVSDASVPNRERRSVPVTNGNLGTLEIRRTFTNTTGAPITKLRMRVIDITTEGTPATCGAGGTSLCADVRALTSADEPAIATSVGVKSTGGLNLEQPPNQPNGGGYNSSLDVREVSVATPLAAGASINVHYTLGVMRSGTFRFFVSFEVQ